MADELSTIQKGEISIRREKLASARWEQHSDFTDKHSFKEGDFWLGRSPITGEMLGYKDDTHILMAAGTRSGKGASIIINNLCAWQGSIVVLDPKGENATVTAARRGPGSEYCQGMEQDVHVLDPFGEAEVKPEFRSRYNPLDTIDVNSVRANDEAMRIVNAIIVNEEKEKGSDFWKLSSKDLLRGIILHVKTDPCFKDRQNLKMVRALLSGGDKEGAKLANEDLEEGEEPHCPFEFLWEAMVQNQALGGLISDIGARIQSAKIEAPETYQGIHLNCSTETQFLDSPAIHEVTETSDFELSELKTNVNGLSIYLCLSTADSETYFRWLRLMIDLVTHAMMKKRGLPANGHEVLMCLDEFACLNRMKTIENSVAQLAGFGLKMLFVVQGFEQLEEVYKKNWQTFMSNTGLKILFGQNDNLMTMEYISKVLGDTEVSRTTRTQSTSHSTQASTSEGTNEQESEGETRQISRGTSDGITTGESQAHMIGTSGGTSETISRNKQFSKQWNRAKGRQTGWNEQQGSGTSQSNNKGKNFDSDALGLTETIDAVSPFRQDKTFNIGQQSGSNKFKSQGRSGGTNEQYSVGGGTSTGTGHSISKNAGYQKSDTHTKSNSHTHTTSFQESKGTTKTFSVGKTQQITKGTSDTKQRGFNEMIQARPLIGVNEVKEWFSPKKKEYAPGDYPGYALVLTVGNLPTIVKRSNYYEDIYFTGWFDPTPEHPAPPKFQVNIIIYKIPEAERLSIEWNVESGQVVGKGDFIGKVGPFHYNKNASFIEEAHLNVDYIEAKVEPRERAFYWHLRAPHTGKVSKQFENHLGDKRIGEISTNRRQIAFDNCLYHFPDAGEQFHKYQQAIEDYVARKKAEKVAEEEERRKQAEALRLKEEEERKRREEECRRREEEERKRREEEERQNKEKEELLEKERRKKVILSVIGGIAAILILAWIVKIVEEKKRINFNKSRPEKIEKELEILVQNQLNYITSKVEEYDNDSLSEEYNEWKKRYHDDTYLVGMSTTKYAYRHMQRFRAYYIKLGFSASRGASDREYVTVPEHLAFLPNYNYYCYELRSEIRKFAGLKLRLSKEYNEEKKRIEEKYPYK